MRVMRAVKSFRAQAKGSLRRGFVEGELAPESHPLVKQHPEYFESAEDYVAKAFPELQVETASAEPGTKRRRSGPKKSEPTSMARSEVKEEDGDEA